MEKCELCGKCDKDLSLYAANHKDLGNILVCRDCWIKLYTENLLVAGSGSSKGCCG